MPHARGCNDMIQLSRVLSNVTMSVSSLISCSLSDKIKVEKQKTFYFLIEINRRKTLKNIVPIQKRKPKLFTIRISSVKFSLFLFNLSNIKSRVHESCKIPVFMCTKQFVVFVEQASANRATNQIAGQIKIMESDPCWWRQERLLEDLIIDDEIEDYVR